MTESGMEEPSSEAVVNGEPNNNIGRRSFMRASVATAVAGAAVVAGVGGLAVPAFADSSTPQLVDAGAGMHAGIGTLQMLGTGTISSAMVTCAVGQMGLDASMISMLTPVLGSLNLGGLLGGLLGGGFSGPFAMLMYSQNVTSYQIDRSAMMITAKGWVRSITKIAGVLIEDQTVPYTAVANDNQGKGTLDSFFLSFKTPFWAVGFNPLATPSQFVSGDSQFGGGLIIGGVNVAAA